ncbi:MAG TPA: hypothetical protein PKV86_15285, partial [Syntrophobacteraceae bacterium]|nr:hypothetical protein [Syntrophobacteraceae bacterium]
MVDNTSNVSRKSSKMFYVGGVLIVLTAMAILGVLLWRHKIHLDVERGVRKESVEGGPLVRVAMATR